MKQEVWSFNGKLLTVAIFAIVAAVLLALKIISCHEPTEPRQISSQNLSIAPKPKVGDVPQYIKDWRARGEATVESRRQATAVPKKSVRVPETTGKPVSSLPNLGIYHGTDPDITAPTGSDMTAYKIFGDTKLHIQSNCTVQNTGTGTFWIADTDTYSQYHILTVASYNTTTGFMGDYYKDDFGPRSYCVSDIPCGTCSPSPGDHFNYICPGQVDTYYDEYPADTVGDYAFMITVNSLGRIQESDQPDKDNVFIFGAHVVVDSSVTGCSPDGLCYKVVRDDAIVTPQVRNKLLHMK